MRWTVLCMMLFGVTVAAYAKDGLDGRTIVVTGGTQTSVSVSVTLPYDGPVPETTVVVLDKETGAICPATVRQGQLVFIPGELKPKEKRTYQVKVLDKTESPKVAIAKVEGKDELTVTVNGEHFTTYHYSNDDKKPFLWPVCAEGGATITRNWPMGETEGSQDHPHHKSIWTAYGDLNGVDCWGEGEDSGYQQSGEVTFGSGDAYGWVRAKNVWQDKDHKPVIDEEREYRFYASPAGARLFDETVTFAGAYGDVKFADTKEGGLMAFRIRPGMEAAKGGQIVNAEGLRGETACWGKPSPWCDYYGEIPGVGTRGIAVFDHPSNLRYPTRWHVRAYGLNGANCFGLSYFTEKEQKAKGEAPLNGDYLLKAKDTLTFNYRVMIHSGDSETAQVAARYADYATPPGARWGE